MTAVRTAQRVLTWAREPTGPLPTGPVDEARELANPDDGTRELLLWLTRETAARLGLEIRPVEKDKGVGFGALLLAAAIGARLQPAVAERLFGAVPAMAEYRLADLVARHGVLRNVVPTEQSTRERALGARSTGPAHRAELSDSLLEPALNGSPLTALLHRPPKERVKSGAVAREMDLARRLMADRRGRFCLTSALSSATTDAAVLNWRVRLLSSLRHEDRDFVLDVYLAARAWHGAEWDTRIASAEEQLASEELPRPEPIGIGRYWAPLAAIARAEPELLRRIPFLDGYQRALDLVVKYRLNEVNG